MMLCVCMYVCVLMCMHMMSAYVCGVSICVCLYVCGGADLAWMMGLESWCLSGLQEGRDGAYCT